MTTDSNNIEEPDEVFHDCQWCGHSYPESETVEINQASRGSRMSGNDNMIRLCYGCQDSVVGCEDCDAAHHADDTHNVNDRLVCDSCYDYYSWCDDHEHYYQDYCYQCEEESDYDSDDGLILNYGYKPAPVFNISRANTSISEPDGVSVTGFELEMEASQCEVHDGARLAHDLFGSWTILKHDGSLNNGFEMVSNPMSHEYFVDVFPWRKVKDLADLGMRSASTRTCGLHVHINKKFFSKNPTSLYRFMSMFYRNQEQWKQLAGRSASTYAVWSEREANSMLRYAKNMRDIYRFGEHDGTDMWNYERYVALNLQNRNTIELRFFKGTLRPETLAARIEAVHAVAQYAVETRNKVNIKSVHDWDRFREWSESKKYNLFNKYANEKGV